MISIIIPTLNERDSLPILFSELSPPLSALEYPVEVVIVDDGSKDGTLDYVQSVKNSFPFSLQMVSRNERGLATAVLRGIQEAKGDILCVMDADLSHPPSHIPEMIKALERGSDMVIGSRHVEGGQVEEWPLHRVVVSGVATLGAKLLVPHVRDPLSGFFACRRSVVEGKTFSPLGYKILLEILVKGEYKNMSEVPYTFRNREVGQSKLNGRVMREYVQHLGRLYVYKLKSLVQ